ncbi:hypothetical protein CDCA_CDCA03G1065 [Cyanidium caldarium]|uniref:3'-5' exonuclease domain-containing protein n=1 Tax=Cyanidium caldarium TaxID=2771 RepID=A0AAV9IRW3_CYACA|nr:hypothetical protein CDCA_CDCA03G1065 [Cyanidium caldarium]
MQWEEEEEEEKEARAHVATGPERCRQHYRERCRKCFPPPKSALATKKRNTEASTRRWRRADGNGNAQVALQRLDALATTTDTDAAANWRAGAWVDATVLGDALEQLLRGGNVPLREVQRRLTKVLLKWAPHRERVLLTSVWVLQSLRASYDSAAAVEPKDVGAERLQCLDIGWRLVTEAARSVLGEARAPLVRMLARNVASGNEAERFVHDQYARLATELVAWRLRVALSEAVDAPSVHRVFRFADPRTLAAIAAVWEVHGLPEADLPYAQTFLEECRRRGALWAAVIAHETFFAGGGTSREELFEAILRTRKFELADECVQLWGDARMAAALERQREEANAALRAPPSPPAARSEADWAHAVARLHAKKVAEQTWRNDGATTASKGYVEWPDSRSRALPRLRVPPHVQVRMVQQVAQVHELAAYMRAYEEQGRSASPPPNPSPCRRLPVGLDVEWRPVLDSGREPHCSLLQVATDTQVFLVDLLSADRDAAFREALDETLQHVLRSDRLLKLGFGFAADLQRLHRCRPSMSCFWVAAPAMDLDRVQAPESPEEAVSVGYPHKRGRVVGGLAGLAATLLRESLDKQDQCSDWQQRPLTDQQVEYAVLDAYVLLRLQPLLPYACPVHAWVGMRALASREQREEGVDGAAAFRTEDASPAPERVQAHLRRAAFADWSVCRIPAPPRRYPPGAEPTEAPRPLPIHSIAQQLGVSPVRIVKCVALLVAEWLPVLVCMAGERRVPLQPLAAALRVPRAHLRMASDRELREVIGFAPGAVTPLGVQCTMAEGAARRPVLVLIDDALWGSAAADDDAHPHGHWVYVSDGSDRQMLRMRIASLCGLVNGIRLSGLVAAAAVDAPPPPLPDCIPASTTATASGTNTWTQHFFTDKHKARFAIDATMGSLVRRLRAMGFDTEHSPQKNVPQLLQLAFGDDDAERDEPSWRVILTRDADVAAQARRRGAPCYYVCTQETNQQAREVIAAFRLPVDRSRFLARCIQCNGERLVERSRNQVAHLLPPRTLETHDTFYECVKCRQLYWRGSHFRRATESLSRLAVHEAGAERHG